MSGLCFAVVDWTLRGIGCGALCGAAIGLTKLRRAVKGHCDNATADAKMPADAYAGKVVWITGASSGIGKELAVQLAKQGAKLILSARRESVLSELAEELKKGMKSGGDVRVLPLDLEDLDSLVARAQQAVTFFGGVDVLVNNGGYTSRALAKDTANIEEEIKMMRVNFLSYTALAKGVMPSMRERKGGIIINISSLAGKFGVPLRTLYCGAKHAVLGWFDALRAEEVGFWQSGITVTNVCPGSVKTDVAVNAVQADGQRRGYSDPNIDAGLDVAFVCDRILAAAFCKVDEVWIAPSHEIQGVYTNQYLPTVFKGIMKGGARANVTKTMGEEFVKARL